MGLGLCRVLARGRERGDGVGWAGIERRGGMHTLAMGDLGVDVPVEEGEG